MIICSKDNPKIKLYRKLLTNKKTRDELDMFVVEGMRICVDTAIEALEENVEITALFYTADSIIKYKNVLDISSFDFIQDDLKYEISAEVAKNMSDEGNSQGVFIIAKKLDKAFDVNSLNHDGKYIVLDNLQDPGNLGTLLRTADAVGVDGVVLSGNCVDLYNPKVVRAAMGSMSRLNIYIENDFKIVAKVFNSLNISLCAAVIRGGTDISEYDFSKPCAAVIGNEGRGLTEEHTMLCSDKMTIKMNGHMDSLNAATAGTIILWEMMRGTKR